MQLDQETVRQVLARAEEIQLQHATGASVQHTNVESIVAAAEESGLSRDAVTQALRERIALIGKPPEPGQRVFAKSTDGKFYVAEVVDAREQGIVVRFLSGSEMSVSLVDLKPFSLPPGHRIAAPWPNWGWYTGRVVSYDQKSERVELSDGWGSEHKFHISEIRLNPEPSGQATDWKAKLWLAALGGVIAGAGLMWLLMRILAR